MKLDMTLRLFMAHWTPQPVNQVLYHVALYKQYCCVYMLLSLEVISEAGRK